MSEEHLQRESHNLPTVLVVMSTIIVGIISAILFWNLSWNAPLTTAVPETIFGIGPIAPGGSVEQTFEGETSYLTGLEIFLHTEPEKDSPVLLLPESRLDPVEGQRVQVPLIMRLYEHDVLLRQGQLFGDVHGGVSTIRWDFEPIKQTDDRLFRLQIVVGDDAEVPIYVMASLTDRLPGGAITNGLPTGDHIDVGILPWRAIKRTDVLLISAMNFPGTLPDEGSPIGLPAMLVAIAALSIFIGYPATRLIPSHTNRMTKSLFFLAFGLAITIFILLIRLMNGTSQVLPEQTPKFWSDWLQIALIVGVGMWLALSRSVGIARWLVMGSRLINVLRSRDWSYQEISVTNLQEALLSTRLPSGFVQTITHLYQGVLRIYATFLYETAALIRYTYHGYRSARQAFGGALEFLLAILVFCAIGLTLMALMINILDGPDPKLVQIQSWRPVGNPPEGNLNIMSHTSTIRPPKQALIAWIIVALVALSLRVVKQISGRST